MENDLVDCDLKYALKHLCKQCNFDHENGKFVIHKGGTLSQEDKQPKSTRLSRVAALQGMDIHQEVRQLCRQFSSMSR